MHEGAGQGQALLVAQGQLLRGAVEEGLELEGVDHLGDAPAPDLAFKTLDARVKGQILPHREQAVEGELLGHVAQPALGLTAGAAQVEPRHSCLPGAGFEQAAQHLEGGGLTRPVGSEEAKDLPGTDLEAHIVRGCEGPEMSGQVPAFDHRRQPQVHRWHPCRQARGPPGSTPQQVDEGVLEARRDRLQPGVDLGGERLKRRQAWRCIGGYIVEGCG